MTTARKHQVSISDTPYYHVMSRCVRRSYLCGTDIHTGQCYEHRREWIAERIRLLSTIFAIDICSYAVMSNHYHIVIKIDAQAPQSWSLDEIIQRWLCLYKGPFLVQKYQKGETLDTAEQRVLEDTVEDWRTRLGSLSEFMQQLNQVIARQANQEERCNLQHLPLVISAPSSIFLWTTLLDLIFECFEYHQGFHCMLLPVDSL